MNETVKDIEDVTIKVEDNLARKAASLIPVTSRGVEPSDFSQVADRAKFMAAAKEAVPAHLRNNVGMCIAIHEMAMEWGLRPYGVANLCYVVNNRLAFEAQLQIAVINKHAGLKQRLRPEYEGEGEMRVCIVRGHFEDEVDPCEYRSPAIGTIKPKNSPLWQVDPDRQLFYYSARAFVRMFASHVMLGIFGRDEIEDNPHLGAEHAKDVSPGLHERLTSGNVNREEGHQGHEHVEREINGTNGASAGEVTLAAESKPKRTRRKKGTAEPEPQPAEAGEQKAEQSEPERITDALPKNPVQWKVYALAWFAAATDAAQIRARWDSERPLRNQCGVTEEERAPVMEAMSARCKEFGE